MRGKKGSQHKAPAPEKQFINEDNNWVVLSGYSIKYKLKQKKLRFRCTSVDANHCMKQVHRVIINITAPYPVPYLTDTVTDSNGKSSEIKST